MEGIEVMTCVAKKLRIPFLAAILAASLAGCGGGGETGSSSSSGPGAGIVSLSWSPVVLNVDDSVCTDLAGYRLYYSQSSPVTKGNSVMVDVGNTTSTDIGGLVSGTTYYFRVSSYDKSGLESDLSSAEAAKIPQ